MAPAEPKKERGAFSRGRCSRVPSALPGVEEGGPIEPIELLRFFPALELPALPALPPADDGPPPSSVRAAVSRPRLRPK